MGLYQFKVMLRQEPPFHWRSTFRRSESTLNIPPLEGSLYHYESITFFATTQMVEEMHKQIPSTQKAHDDHPDKICGVYFTDVYLSVYKNGMYELATPPTSILFPFLYLIDAINGAASRIAELVEKEHFNVVIPASFQKYDGKTLLAAQCDISKLLIEQELTYSLIAL